MPAQKLHHPEPHPSFTSLIDERTLAARWGVSVKTLRNWRLTGHGPPFRKIGRCVRYGIGDVVRFEEGARRRSTSERGDHAPL